MILGRYYIRNVYPQSLNHFTRNDFGQVWYPQCLLAVAWKLYLQWLWVGIIPAMFTRSRLTTLPAMILGRNYTCNVYPQSLNNFTRNDFG